MAALAEYTITRPKKISSATVVKSTRSNASFLAIRTSTGGQRRPHLALEGLAAVGEAADLVVAGAGRRQHHRLAGQRPARRRPHRGGESAGELDRRGAAERPLQLAGGL